MTRHLVKQHSVERGTIHRIDDLVRAAPIELQFTASIELVQQPAAHGDEQRFDDGHGARTLECANAARRERKIDGTAARARRAARIGAPVVELDRKTAPRQEQGEQRTGKTGADDAHRLRAHCAQAVLLKSCPRYSLNLQTSSKRL